MLSERAKAVAVVVPFLVVLVPFCSWAEDKPKRELLLLLLPSNTLLGLRIVVVVVVVVVFELRDFCRVFPFCMTLLLFLVLSLLFFVLL